MTTEQREEELRRWASELGKLATSLAKQFSIMSKAAESMQAGFKMQAESAKAAADEYGVLACTLRKAQAEVEETNRKLMQPYAATGKKGWLQ